MKRSPLKRGKPKRRKKSEITKLSDSLWELCKILVRAKYGNTCFTCGKTGLTGSNWQTGHFIPRSTCGAFLKYDLRNLRPQCFHCNINLGGNGAVFYRRMVEAYGQEYVDEIFRDRNKLIVSSDYCRILLVQYEREVSELST